MDKINLDYDLIGIGELTHGELTSWKIRYDIVKRLINENKKVYILCEQADFFINHLNSKNVNFIYKESGFYPNMVARSNLSKEHLKITKKFNKLLPNVYFYGIDIQIVEHDYIYSKLSGVLKNIMKKYDKLFLKHAKTNKRGIYRNYINYLIINDLIKKITSNNNSFVYFAQNEHISFMSKFKNNKSENYYLPEGYYLKNNLNYFSVGTCALNQYTVWYCNLLKKCKIKMYKIKSKKWEKIFEKDKKKLVVLDCKNNLILPINEGRCNSKDFDYIIAEYCSDKLSLLEINEKEYNLFN